MQEPSYSSFEYQAMILESQTSVPLISICRPPKYTASFLPDLSICFTNHDRILITGDFNLHIDNVSDFNAMDFLQLLHSFDFIQHTAEPTHNCGHTLNLVIS